MKGEPATSGSRLAEVEAILFGGRDLEVIHGADTFSHNLEK
jgi:hypothetical protein